MEVHWYKRPKYKGNNDVWEAVQDWASENGNKYGCKLEKFLSPRKMGTSTSADWRNSSVRLLWSPQNDEQLGELVKLSTCQWEICIVGVDLTFGTGNSIHSNNPTSTCAFRKVKTIISNPVLILYTRQVYQGFFETHSGGSQTWAEKCQVLRDWQRFSPKWGFTKHSSSCNTW